MPIEEQFKAAYYYTDNGTWRGPEVDEFERWHAVARVAADNVKNLQQPSDYDISMSLPRKDRSLKDEQEAQNEELVADADGARYADLPMVSEPGRDWTDAERAAFPLWARVCYVVRPFNSACHTFGHWMRVFGDTEGWTCECGMAHEGAGSFVLRLLDAVGD